MSRVGQSIVLLVMWCLISPLIVMAEPTYDEYGDLIRPEAKKFSGILEEFGPEKDGVISMIIINDTSYRVDKETLYRSKDGAKSRLSRFQENTLVNYYAIGYLLTNLSAAADSEEINLQNIEDQSISAPAQSEIRQEDGVWKN